ncbi:MAG: ABC transporter substrate-binding protein [Lachnospiraceae bacterium]|nr:ABC transporter substrate-binding protein [Lachnospiraceae bacterium]
MRKKQKLKRMLVLMLAVVFVLCGCESVVETGQEIELKQNTEQPSETPDAKMQGQEQITFVDDLGRQVQSESPQRVVALIGSFADIWLLAGGELVAAANDSWESLELPLDDSVVNLGSITQPDAERLIAAQPDLVLASANTAADLELEELLTQAGISVAYFGVSDFEEYLHMLDICTQLTGRRDLYEEHGLRVQEEIEQVLGRADGSAPEVLFLRASASSVKAKGSDGNVCGEMLADLGCINIADKDGSLLDELSMEAIIAADPDYIFVTLQGNDQEAAIQNIEQLLIEHPAWSSLTAIKEGRYYMLDKRLYNLKPNARWGEAYRKLADILYPEG